MREAAKCTSSSWTGYLNCHLACPLSKSLDLYHQGYGLDYDDVEISSSFLDYVVLTSALLSIKNHSVYS